MSDDAAWMNDPAVIAAASSLVDALDASAIAHGHGGLVAFIVAAHCSNSDTGTLMSGERSSRIAADVLLSIAGSYGVKTELVALFKRQVMQ